MKLSDLDFHPDYSRAGSGLGGPIAASLQWLATCLASPAVQWHPAQREAACKALREARELLGSDVLTLGHAVTSERVTP